MGKAITRRRAHLLSRTHGQRIFREAETLVKMAASEEEFIYVQADEAAYGGIPFKKSEILAIPPVLFTPHPPTLSQSTFDSISTSSSESISASSSESVSASSSESASASSSTSVSISSTTSATDSAEDSLPMLP